MHAQMPGEYLSRLVNSAADEFKFLRDWRSGIPEYHAPTFDPECAFWEVTFPKKQSPCTITGLSRFYPLQLRGQPDSPVSAVHKNLLDLVNLSDIQLNRLHSFMQYLPVKCAIRTFLIQLEHMPHPQSPDGELEYDYDFMYADLTSRLGQPVLGEMLSYGPRYVERCLSSCLRKLIALHDHAGLFWDFGSGQPLVDLCEAIIDLYQEAWEAFKPWAPPGSTVEDWIFWTKTSDPWIVSANDYVLESRPLHEYWPAKPEPGTKRSKTPPWGVWKPKPEELAAMQAEALGLAVSPPALPALPAETLWEFESILESRWQGKGRYRKVWFLVQWKGYESTWQPEDDFSGLGCDQWLLKYYDNFPEAAGPPKWLMA